MAIVAACALVYLSFTLYVSALQKIAIPGRFRLALLRQRLFPAWAMRVFQIVVPAWEVTVALWLLIDAGSLFARIAIASTFVAFAAFRGFLLVRRPGADCGCGSSSEAVEGPDVAAVIIQALIAMWLATAGMDTVATFGDVERVLAAVAVTFGVVLTVKVQSVVRQRIRLLELVRTPFGPALTSPVAMRREAHEVASHH